MGFFSFVQKQFLRVGDKFHQQKKNLPEFPVGEHGEDGVEEAREPQRRVGHRLVGEAKVVVGRHQTQAQ